MKTMNRAKLTAIFVLIICLALIYAVPAKSADVLNLSDPDIDWDHFGDLRVEDSPLSPANTLAPVSAAIDRQTNPVATTPQPSLTYGVLNADGVRIRKAPDTTNSENVLGFVSKGDSVEILGIASGSGYEWYHVTTMSETTMQANTQSGVEGYIVSQYIDTTTSSTTSALTAPTASSSLDPFAFSESTDFPGSLETTTPDPFSFEGATIDPEFPAEETKRPITGVILVGVALVLLGGGGLYGYKRRAASRRRAAFQRQRSTWRN